jgi:hypothetical protein
MEAVVSIELRGDLLYLLISPGMASTNRQFGTAGGDDTDDLLGQQEAGYCQRGAGGNDWDGITVSWTAR